MEERIKAEELVVKFVGLSRAYANAALGQLKAYREGRYNILDYAFENSALVDAVGFWRDYGLENLAMMHLAKVAINVLGIAPHSCNSAVFVTPIEQESGFPGNRVQGFSNPTTRESGFPRKGLRGF